jgi:glycosyltransferase involved in cell wall biosynthesis
LLGVHVGRTGEVAGGMTQVVNSYTNWNFDRFDTRVIRSRDGRVGPRALVLYLGAALALLRLANDGNSVVIVHLSQGGSFIREGSLLWIAAARRLPTVAQLHGSSFVAFASRRQRLVRAVLGRARSIHVLSKETADTVSRLVPTAQVYLIPNAVAPGVGSSKESLVVFGGAVSRRKGVDVLVAAWDRIADVAAGWTLVIAGPLLEPGLVAAVPSSVKVRGSIPHAELLALLERSSIAVLPSMDEAMPMFILEALARDNCVVSTPVGGIPKLLDGGRGMLVAAGDVQALADALALAMGDAAAARAVAHRGRASFDATFSAVVVMPRLEDMWEGAIRRQPVPA